MATRSRSCPPAFKIAPNNDAVEHKSLATNATTSLYDSSEASFKELRVKRLSHGLATLRSTLAKLTTWLGIYTGPPIPLAIGMLCILQIWLSFRANDLAEIAIRESKLQTELARMSVKIAVCQPGNATQPETSTTEQDCSTTDRRQKRSFDGVLEPRGLIPYNQNVTLLERAQCLISFLPRQDIAQSYLPPSDADLYAAPFTDFPGRPLWCSITGKSECFFWMCFAPSHESGDIRLVGGNLDSVHIDDYMRDVSVPAEVVAFCLDDAPSYCSGSMDCMFTFYSSGIMYSFTFVQNGECPTGALWFEIPTLHIGTEASLAGHKERTQRRSSKFL